MYKQWALESFFEEAAEGLERSALVKPSTLAAMTVLRRVGLRAVGEEVRLTTWPPQPSDADWMRSESESGFAFGNSGSASTEIQGGG